MRLENLQTLRVTACRKWNVKPFTTEAGNVDFMALIAASSKSVKNVYCPASPNIRMKVSLRTPNSSAYDAWDLFGRKAHASAIASPCT